MPTVITRTIGTSGRNYSTILAWEAFSDTNLVDDDEQHDGVLYDDEDFLAGHTIAGAVVDATRYRHLFALSGQEYDPVADTGVNIAASVPLLTCNEAYFRSTGFAFLATSTGINSVLLIQAGNQTHSQLYADMTSATGTFTSAFKDNSSSGGSLCVNCIVEGGDWTYEFRNGAVDTYNCVGWGVGDISSPAVGRVIQGIAGMTINNMVNANGSIDYHGGGVENYNCSEDGSASGAQSITNQTMSTIWNDQANGDYRPPDASANTIDAGVDRSSTFTQSFEPGVDHDSGSTGWEMGPYDDSAIPGGGGPNPEDFLRAPVNTLLRM